MMLVRDIGIVLHTNSTISLVSTVLVRGWGGSRGKKHEAARGASSGKRPATDLRATHDNLRHTTISNLSALAIIDGIAYHLHSPTPAILIIMSTEENDEGIVTKLVNATVKFLMEFPKMKVPVAMRAAMFTTVESEDRAEQMKIHRALAKAKDKLLLEGSKM